MIINNNANAFCGLFIAIGLIVAGYQISTTMYKARAASNVVTVKGFAERDVKADLALWQIGFSVAGDDLTKTYEKVDQNGSLIQEFLGKKGFAPEEVAIGKVNVSDMQTNQYRSGNELAGSRYVIQGNATIRSEQVDKVDIAAREFNTLVKQGLVVSNNTVEYQFTKLKEIKPEMLKEATQNARQAAEQFAKDANSAVGSIKSANQGFFSIASRDAGDNGEGSGNGMNDINKKVRVVTSVTYYLDK